MCIEYLKEYFSRTSLHGLQYIGEEKRSIVERVWWCLIFVLSVVACSHLIMKVWVKWNQSPVIVSFAETSTPVWQIPFPAITVCSETKARQSIYNFTEMYHRENLTEEEKLDYETISLVCDSHILTEGSNFTEDVDLLRKVAPEFDEMLWVCKMKSSFENCSQVFSPIMTEEGLCYTFNMLDSEEFYRKDMLHKDYYFSNHSKKSKGWTLEGGYPPEIPLKTYPIRGSGTGSKSGLALLLRAYNYDLDYLCRGPVQGFKISLHSPAEFPRVSEQYFRVPLSQEVIAAIKPNVMTTSDGLKDYKPERRKCFFPSERKLKFFQIYTQKNCELECLANYTNILCGCVSFSMPRDETMRICSSGKTTCLDKARDDLLTQEILLELYENDEITLIETLKNVAKQCNCMAACTSINYDVEVSSASFDWEKLFIAADEDFNEFPDVNLARLVVFFKESEFITSKRSELYGQTDFLANCGGLLGLFLGFSILSFFEIFYFITLRAFCNLKNHFKRTKVHCERAPDTIDLPSNYRKTTENFQQ